MTYVKAGSTGSGDTRAARVLVTSDRNATRPCSFTPRNLRSHGNKKPGGPSFILARSRGWLVCSGPFPLSPWALLAQMAKMAPEPAVPAGAPAGNNEDLLRQEPDRFMNEGRVICHKRWRQWSLQERATNVPISAHSPAASTPQGHSKPGHGQLRHPLLCDLGHSGSSSTGL